MRSGRPAVLKTTTHTAGNEHVRLLWRAFRGEIAIVLARVDDLGAGFLFDQLAQPLDDVEHEIFFQQPFASHRAKIPAVAGIDHHPKFGYRPKSNPRGFFPRTRNRR